MAHRIQALIENERWDNPLLMAPQERLIEPEKVQLQEYPSVHLIAPEFVHVPEKSRAMALLEDSEHFSELIGTSLAGLLKSRDSDDDSSEDDIPIGKMVHVVGVPEVAVLAGTALGIAGLSRVVRRQLELPRQNAIEANKRIERQAAILNEFRFAEADLSHRRVKEANADILRSKRESHRFLERQLEIQSQTSIARMEAQVMDRSHILEAAVLLEKDRQRHELDRQKIKVEQEDRKLDTEARLFENGQQLTSQALESYERVAMDGAAKRAEQSAQDKEFMLQCQRQTFGFLSEQLSRWSQMVKEVFKSRTAPAVDPLQDSEVREESQPRFICSLKENRCLNGFTLHRLLTGGDFTSEMRQRIRFAFEGVLRIHTEKLEEQGREVSTKSVLESVSLDRELCGLPSLEFFDFILESLSDLSNQKKVQTLDELFAIYINQSRPI